MSHDLTRRAVLAGFAGTMAPLAALAQVAPLCPADPAISNPQAPLTIDTHAHFFNGGDLQIRDFLAKTSLKELRPLSDGLGALLQVLAWHLAPNAQKEFAAMSRYAAALQH